VPRACIQASMGGRWVCPDWRMHLICVGAMIGYFLNQQNPPAKTSWWAAAPSYIGAPTPPTDLGSPCPPQFPAKHPPMAGPNPEAFDRALSRFRRTLPLNYSYEFSICTLQDVRQEIRKIQDEQGAQGNLRYLGRIGGFVEAMEQFGAVLDLFVNANELVCFIWVRALCLLLKVLPC